MIKEVTFYYPKDLTYTEKLYKFRMCYDFEQMLTCKYTQNITRELKNYKTGKFIIRVKINWFNSKKFDKFLKDKYSKTKIIYTIKNIYGGNMYENGSN